MTRLTGNIAKTILICALAITAANSQASQFMLMASPYVGADVEIRHIDWASNLGSNVFKNNYPQGKVYGGLRFCDFIGIEVGYEATIAKTAKNTLPVGGIYLGDAYPFSARGPVLAEGRFEISGPYAAILGFLPITCDDNVFISFGAVSLKASHWTYLLGDADLGVLNPEQTQLRFSKTKTVLRIGGGWEHLFCSCFGLRLNVAWENTTRFSQLKPENNPTSIRRVSLKNSWNYGFGIFYQF